MCSICGWLNTQNRINVDVLKKMNNIVAYRGPDDEGYVSISKAGVSSFSGKDSCVKEYPLLNESNKENAILWFGHRRLSIIDLSNAGHQPMQSEDGNYVITFNGEIYNYLEIRDELEKVGYIFKSNSDTEVLLKAYVEWGEQCVNKFNGMWAFCIWDGVNKKMFCSRDRLGAKPFYYYIDEENFIFSSEIKQLCQNPIVPRILNDDVVVTQMVWGLTDYSSDTLIKDIKSLLGGQNLSLSLDENCSRIENFEVKQYWDINTSVKDSKAVEKIWDIHKNAVEIRTRSDVPIGMLLSGGLDSSVLVAEVSNYFAGNGIPTEDINTFTSCYEDFEEGNEKKYAELTADYCNVSPNYVYPDEKDTLSLYKDMIWHVEGNFGLNALGSFMTLKEISKSGIKVMINGQGSDETMFGYERYYAWYLKDVFREKGLKTFLIEVKEAVNNSKLSYRNIIQYLLYFNLYKIRKIRNIKRIGVAVSDYVINEAKACDTRSIVEFETMADLQYGEIRKTQLTHILRGDDRMYMAFSMESRVPFIDYRYIEKAVSIPEKEKITNGYTKFLLRKHIEGKLPDEVVWRKNKMGWPSPRDRWIDRFDKDKIEELFIDPKSHKYFNIDKVKEIYKKNPYSYAFEQFLNLEIFMRLFDIQEA